MTVRRRLLLLPFLISAATPLSAQTIASAKQLFDQGKYTQAKTAFLALEKTNSKNAAVAYYLGRVAVLQDSADVAITRFERAVELEDRNAVYHLWLGNALGEAAQSASMFKQATMARRMKNELERSLELDPNQVDARTSLVQFYTVAPAVMGGGKDKAQEQVREITKRSPFQGAIMRGWMARQDKNVAAEETAYQQAITAKPDTTAGYVALSDFYVREKKFPEAFATMERYANRRPADRWNPYYAGRLAGQTGQQLDRGEASLKQFIAKPPANSLPPVIARGHYWLGQIAEKRGAKDAARAAYQTALKVDPELVAAKKALDALK